jgi:hypothetical protein
MVKTFRLNKTQPELIELSNKLIQHMPEIFDYFGVNCCAEETRWSGVCPVHGGDNTTAFNLYHSGMSCTGNWYCWTHNCQNTFNSSALGFVRGLLSRKNHGWTGHGDTTESFGGTIEWCEKFLEGKIEPSNAPKYDYVKKRRKTAILPSLAKKHLQIPSPYFLSRGVSAEILVKYDVGDCFERGKEMNQRAVVPVYDVDHKLIVGCSGRSVNESCGKCGCYHNEAHRCPSHEYRKAYSKWRHSKNFDRENSLYNLWSAKEHIFNTGVAILVESPGNVWKIEESGIYCSVAAFGTRVTDSQICILKDAGMHTLIILMDPDEAGVNATQELLGKYQKTLNVVAPKLDFDIGDCQNTKRIYNLLRKFVK